MSNQDKPSFPFNPTQPWDSEAAKGFPGLTKREYIATMAMQGLLANPNIFQLYPGGNPNTLMNIVSIASIEHADDILTELQKS